MATPGRRGKAWWGVFVQNDDDLEYFDRAHYEDFLDFDDDEEEVPGSMEVENRCPRIDMVSGFTNYSQGDGAGAASRTFTPDDNKQSGEQNDLSVISCDSSMASVALVAKDEKNIYITDSSCFKGIKEHVDDLRLSDVVVKKGDVAVTVAARSKVVVLGEYTFIQITPTQEKDGQFFPAIYVPGNAFNWKTPPPRMVLNPGGAEPIVLRDEHHARQPNFPYEPTLRALLTMQHIPLKHMAKSVQATAAAFANVNMHTVEIFADAEVLGQLFTFLAEPDQARPFRLELSLVRNTLFLEPGRHHGAGHTDKGGAVKRSVVQASWGAEAIRKNCFDKPRLPHSGGHYRVVRYRMGDLVCVVRSQVDFIVQASEVRKGASTAAFDPLAGIHPETIVEEEEEEDKEAREEVSNSPDDEDEHENQGENILTWRTTVKDLGKGTKPDQAGKTALRYDWEDDDTFNNRILTTELPLLWFSRTSYLIEAVISHRHRDHLIVLETSRLRSVDGRDYRAWEREYQATLQQLVALLHQMKAVTRAQGGSCVLVLDPTEQNFMVMQPVLQKKAPVPAEIISALWGGDAHNDGDDNNNNNNADTEYESTVTSQSSELSTLSELTPSGVSDWKIVDNDNPSARRMKRRLDQKQWPSRKLVNEWLTQSQSDDHDGGRGNVVDMDVAEEFINLPGELAPNDSQSRGGEDSISSPGEVHCSVVVQGATPETMPAHNEEDNGYASDMSSRSWEKVDNRDRRYEFGTDGQMDIDDDYDVVYPSIEYDTDENVEDDEVYDACDEAE